MEWDAWASGSMSGRACESHEMGVGGYEVNGCMGAQSVRGEVEDGLAGGWMRWDRVGGGPGGGMGW